MILSSFLMGQSSMGPLRVCRRLPSYCELDDTDVLGIDQGISVLMAENLRSELVWKTFMHDKETVRAMQQAGFHRHDLKG
jgi:hypothetical protein